MLSLALCTFHPRWITDFRALYNVEYCNGKSAVIDITARGMSEVCYKLPVPACLWDDRGQRYGLRHSP